MLTYNTQQKKLILPEYGRNIQQMVEHCLTIEDRDERTRAAHTIIRAMSALVPQTEKNEDARRKLWNHLAIMSDFKLDIDYPYELMRPENLDTRPEQVIHYINNFKYRHYGKNILDLIHRAIEMEPGEERETLVMLIANHMKKNILEINPDGVEDEIIYNDLAELSHGEFRLSSDDVHLHEFRKAPEAKNGKKKKKK